MLEISLRQKSTRANNDQANRLDSAIMDPVSMSANTGSKIATVDTGLAGIIPKDSDDSNGELHKHAPVKILYLLQKWVPIQFLWLMMILQNGLVLVRKIGRILAEKTSLVGLFPSQTRMALLSRQTCVCQTKMNRTHQMKKAQGSNDWTGFDGENAFKADNAANEAAVP